MLDGGVAGVVGLQTFQGVATDWKLDGTGVGAVLLGPVDETDDPCALAAGVLAPLVMAVLGNMTRRQGLDSNALSGVLGQERNRLQQGGIGGLLAGVLDRDGDGQVGLDEMLQAGAGLLGSLGKR